MLTVLVILAVLGILFGAAVLATYEGEVLKDPHPDDRGGALPAAQLQPEDVAELRFDMALRGYRMSEVDAVMERLGDELADRDARIARLEQALVEVVEPAVTAAEQLSVASAPVDMPEAPVEQTQAAVPEEGPAAVEAYEPLEPPAAAPAAISGPLTATTWFTEPAPAASAVPAEDPEPAVASAPVDIPDAPPEQTQALEEPEPSVASAQVDTADAELEQTPAPALEPDEPAPSVASAPVDIPDAQPEQTQDPEALTLPAGDDAFSFPELQLPDPAAPDTPEATDQDRPAGE